MEQNPVLQFITNEPFIAFVLILMSLVAVAAIVERFLAFKQFGDTMPGQFNDVLELVRAGRDSEALRLVLSHRQEKSKRYFDAVAGRLGKKYCPGRSWEAVGRLFLVLAPRETFADLGAGEGLISQLLAARAKKVIAVDNSPRMVEVDATWRKRAG